MKLFALAAIITITLISNSSFAQIKIGYVDSEVILKQLPEAKKVQTDLEGLQKLYVDTVQVKEIEIKTKAEAFKARYDEAQKQVESGVIKSEAELKALNEEISNLQKEIQNLSEGLDLYKQKVQNDLLARQNEMFKPIRDKVSATIETVAKDLKYNFVFDKAAGSMLYGEKESDITFKVLDKLK
ncbi:hypothetical protein BH10BAC5_BH10BAC5_11930 [soil metagenome]